jgi:hypothetical protein
LLPFRFRQWIRLAFVGVLAGELGFGGCNFNWPADTPNQTSSSAAASSVRQILHAFFSDWLTLTLIGVGIFLLLLLLYVSSVMRFVLFDSIVERECHVRRGWKRRHRPGFRLFLWRLGFLLAVIGGLLAVVGGPVAGAYAAGWFGSAEVHLAGLIIGGILVFVVAGFIAVVAAVIDTMTKDFVVPQMALEDLSTMEGWRGLWFRIRSERGSDYVVYILIKIALSLAATVALVFAVIAFFVLLLIVFGGIGLAASLVGRHGGWDSNPLAIVALILWICLGLLIAVLGLAMLCVPQMVFLPAYAIYFFAGRYAPLAAVLSPEQPGGGAAGEGPTPAPA